MKRNAEKNRLDRLQLAKHKEKKTQINYIEKKIEELLISPTVNFNFNSNLVES